MNKLLIIVMVLILLAGGGFLVYRNYFSSKTAVTSSEPAKNQTQVCDLQKQTCMVNSKTTNSGSLKVSIVSSGAPVKSLEVDIGIKPGASQYYLKFTGEDGIALFEGIPAGSYVIYFNQESFPSGLIEPAPQAINVLAGQTTQTNINLSK